MPADDLTGPLDNAAETSHRRNRVGCASEITKRADVGAVERTVVRLPGARVNRDNPAYRGVGLRSSSIFARRRQREQLSSPIR